MFSFKFNVEGPVPFSHVFGQIDISGPWSAKFMRILNFGPFRSNKNMPSKILTAFSPRFVLNSENVNLESWQHQARRFKWDFSWISAFHDAASLDNKTSLEIQYLSPPPLTTKWGKYQICLKQACYFEQVNFQLFVQNAALILHLIFLQLVLFSVQTLK